MTDNGASSTPVALQLRKAPGARDRILDAAEQLFGAHGYDSVSLRDISTRASVNLGLFHYHFGGKDGLFEEVAGRRALALGRERQRRLRALQDAGPTNLEGVMDAFMAPLFELMRDGGEGGRAYVRLLDALAHNDRWLDLFARHFDATALLFLAELRLILLRQTESALLHGFSLALNAMLATAAPSRRFESLGLHADPEAVYRRLLDFVCSGMRGLNEGTT
jgi:AcrR family transcriptional regulator